MQQSYATQSLHLSFWGLRKIVACSHSSSQCLLVSTVFGTVSSLHPTSFLMIFILVSFEVAGCLQKMVDLVLSLDLITRLSTLDTVKVWLIQCLPCRITSLLFSEPLRT